MLNSRNSIFSSSRNGVFGSNSRGGAFGQKSFDNTVATDSSSDYKIENLENLETSSANLAKYNQQITDNVNSLNYILKSIRENWENEAGEDIQSILLNLNDNISTLKNEIQPIIAKYVDTINQIVTETRINQNRDLSN